MARSDDLARDVQLLRSGASSPRSITDAIAVCVCTIGRADLYHEPRRQLVQPVCCGGELLPRSTPRAPDAIGFTLDEVLEPNAADDGASSSLCCARSIRLTGTCNLHLHVYQFRHLVEADRSLIARWRAAQHVREWWGAPSVEEEGEKLLDPRIAMWIVELDGRPFAFAQDYDVHGWHPHPFSYLPPRSRGIDQYIGEVDMLDQGHGSRFVRQHVERLFAAGAPAVGTDPHPSNARARRAYEKAGFAVTSEPVDTPWGRAILMECWPT